MIAKLAKFPLILRYCIFQNRTLLNNDRISRSSPTSESNSPGRIKTFTTLVFCRFWGLHGVFSEKNPVSDHPCIQDYLTEVRDLCWLTRL